MSGKTTTHPSRYGPSRKGLRSLTAHEARTSDIFAGRGFQNPQIVLRWREFAGPVLGRLTAPITLSPQGLLTISADPSVAILLQHQTQTLIQRINLALGGQQILKVKVISGKFTRPKAAKTPKPVPSAHRDWAARTTNGVQDAQLRAALARLGEAVAEEGGPIPSSAPLRPKS